MSTQEKKVDETTQSPAITQSKEEFFKSLEENESVKPYLTPLKRFYELGNLQYFHRAGNKFIMVLNSETEIDTAEIQMLTENEYFKEVSVEPTPISLIFADRPLTDDETEEE